MFPCNNGCGRTFATPRAQTCHFTRCINPVPFEQLKKDGSRRIRLLVERGHKCEVCNNSSWNELPIPLELDHVDGDPEHNEKINLRLICPNCHAQTPTYKGKNMGKVTNSKRSQTLKKYYGKYR